MYELRYDPGLCLHCENLDCLTRCQHLEYNLEQARVEKQRLLDRQDCRLLHDCLTCYACEEYCPFGNHPFYQIVELQEEMGILPAPEPITTQQIRMMQPRHALQKKSLTPPVIDMCFFPMLESSIQGKLYQDASIISGADIFCNIMWLHFAKGSVIRERLPRVIETIWELYLRDNNIDELVCYHDECYAAFTHLAPAYGMEVPFSCLHLFEYLSRRLDSLQQYIRPLGLKVAYQRPCSNRLVPEIQPFVDQIFAKIGVERVEREYDRENALCCGGIVRAQQRDDLADRLQEKNLQDMKQAGAEYCVLNCPFCYYTLDELLLERGIKPVLMSDLCRLALQEKEA
ncbi:MAG: heterodisulfide reductase-related iron-sulfur binding cluster [Desulfohalobiaceae bacterium]